MTKQAVFDQVAKHLLTQKAKSHSEGCCAYRGDYDRKCAVGCLIPDNVYRKDLEGSTVKSDRFKSTLRQLGLESCVQLLKDLQVVHDQADPSYWKRRLTTLADGWDLNPAVLANYD